MSHRKFEAPRHGSLAFLPRKRTKHHHGKIKSFPKDNQSEKCHFTGFMGFKAGMTHIVRDMDRPASKLHKREVVEAVTIVDTPPMRVVGFVAYMDDPRGMKAMTSVWAQTLSDECKRRFYKNWYRSKEKAFTNYSEKFTEEEGKQKMERQIARAKKYATSIRAICHTQLKYTPLVQKKAHIVELQINGGSISDKVDYCVSMFEQEITIDSVFSQDEMIDICAATKGHGNCGVTTRWGVSRLPRKTHRGLRKVACIGAWHPARVQFTVPRAGQRGYHHRTEMNKKIYRIGASLAQCTKDKTFNASTENDLTEKNITPMGGFPHYGIVKNQYLMIKGCCAGPKTRAITLRKSLVPHTKRSHLEKIKLKFIDTSSKFGHGRFQTSEEKRKFYGPGKVAADDK